MVLKLNKLALIVVHRAGSVVLNWQNVLHFILTQQERM